MHVMDKGGVPHTRYVRGTNYNFISVFPDRLPGRAIVISGAHTALCMLLSHADCWVSSSCAWRNGSCMYVSIRLLRAMLLPPT